MSSKRKKRAKRQKKKGIYILPNLFTSASLFSGFYAIIAAIQGRYEGAALAVIISGIFDGIDGRVARFTRATSLFGKEFDSLSDLLAFGAAPAVLSFLWALEPYGRLGWLAAFMYVICGALRLARFNVQSGGLSADYFKGLPIPAAACFIAALILFTETLGGIPQNKPMIIIFMIYMLSFLMVSNMQYYSFKGFDIRNQRPFNVLVSIILILIVVAYKPKIIFFFIMLAYIFSGPVLTLYRLQRRRASAHKTVEEASNLKKDGEFRRAGDETPFP